MKFIFKIIAPILFTLISLNTQAQQTIEVLVNDIVELEADEYRGTIQWQKSTDDTDWTNIDGGTVSPFSVVADELPVYYRAEIIEERCEPHYSEIISVIDSGILRWSDPTTWGEAGIPTDGQMVIITEEMHVLLDVSSANLSGLTIEGILEFDRKDLNLTSEWIVVNGGTLRAGTEAYPFEQKAILTLNDTDTEFEAMNMGTRGIMVMSGALELHGATDEVIWTKLNQHGEIGQSSLDLIQPVAWKEGDEIVIAPTDYYAAGNGISVTQRVALNNVNGNQITIAEGLNAFRWGLLQYPTSAGMSLTPDDSFQPPVADTETTTTPLVLDQRAEVGHMTRNIVIQAPDDDLWTAQEFGVHTMIMPNATAHVEGVEFKRGGQAGRMRRYPFHWHMLSYSGSETLEDATGQYFKRNTINSSANRGVVIHGTNGVLVQENIIFDIKGHGIFTEDAAERRNVIDGNLVFHIRNPVNGSQLKIHEVTEKGSSAFWISNPDNIVINNIAADSRSFGFWLTYPNNPWGLSQGVLHTDGQVLRPSRIEFGVFDNNTAHSNRNDGVHLDNVEIDNDGNTAEFQYVSTKNGRTVGEEYVFTERFTLSRTKTWKNMDNGSWDRGVATDIIEYVSADNCGRFFAGSGGEGVIERSLVVGTSLNFMMNGTGRPATADFQFYPSANPTAFATYHGAFSMRDNIVVNFPVNEYDRMGVFAADDYYFRPVEKSMERNYNNLTINSNPGVKLKPEYNYYTFASAMLDPYGLWGPEGSFFVYDDPFLTYGKEVHMNELGTEIVGGVSVEGPFYGFYGFVLHGVGWTPPESQPYLDVMEINISRLDDDMNEVASWNVPRANPSWALQHMRDFATSPDGLYLLTFPDEPALPTEFDMYFENLLTPEDQQVIGVQYDCSITPLIVYSQQRNKQENYHGYSQVNSLQEVKDSNGETWWADVPNNVVWIKLKGGRWLPPSGDMETESYEQTAYHRMIINIEQAD